MKLTKENWSSKYFTVEEMRCKHTGALEMEKDFIALLDIIREECGFPFVITSGYRHETHPVEARKKRAGTHAKGCAVDIKATPKQAMKIMEVAKYHGITRIGVAKSFIHLDCADWYYSRYSSDVLWGY